MVKVFAFSNLRYVIHPESLEKEKYELNLFKKLGKTLTNYSSLAIAFCPRPTRHGLSRRFLNPQRNETGCSPLLNAGCAEHTFQQYCKMHTSNANRIWHCFFVSSTVTFFALHRKRSSKNLHRRYTHSLAVYCRSIYLMVLLAFLPV